MIRRIELAALALMLAAGPAAAQQKPSIKVGAILPMTGMLASVGIMFKAGIDVGVDEVNAQGGVNGSPIELVVEDDQLVPEQSVIGYRKLAGSAAVATLGPISSSSWANVSPIAPRVGLPAISFTFTYKEGVPNSDWTIGVSPDERTMLPEAVAEYMKLYPNVKRVVVAPDVQQDSGATAGQIFQREAKKYGVQVLDVVEFQTTTTDFAPIVTRIRGQNPDAIWSAGTIPGVLGILHEMQSQNVDLTVFNDGMIWPGAFPQVAGPSGGKVYTLGFSTNEPLKSNEKHNAYVQRFQAKLRNDPATPQPPNTGNSVMGYEAVKLLASILERNKIDGTTDPAKARELIKQAIDETKEFHDIYDVKFDAERNAYIPAHLLKDDPTAKEWKYAIRID